MFVLRAGLVTLRREQKTPNEFISFLRERIVLVKTRKSENLDYERGTNVLQKRYEPITKALRM